MDIDIKSFVVFVDALSSLYTTLNGIAIIQEAYGEQQYIELRADRSGHITIRGKLSSNGRGGFLQELSFLKTKIDFVGIKTDFIAICWILLKNK